MAQRTAQYVIEGAFRKLGIGAHGETLSSEMQTDGLNQLNDMLHGLNLDGAEYAHKDVIATDPINLEQDEVEAAIYCLAERIAPDYGVSPLPAVLSFAEIGRRLLQSRYTIKETVGVDSGLLRMPGQRWYDRGW